jgi:hypothetical protein
MRQLARFGDTAAFETTPPLACVLVSGVSDAGVVEIRGAVSAQAAVTVYHAEFDILGVSELANEPATLVPELEEPDDLYDTLLAGRPVLCT